jgi:hypothetical protein
MENFEKKIWKRKYAELHRCELVLQFFKEHPASDPAYQDPKLFSEKRLSYLIKGGYLKTRRKEGMGMMFTAHSLTPKGHAVLRKTERYNQKLRDFADSL